MNKKSVVLGRKKCKSSFSHCCFKVQHLSININNTNKRAVLPNYTLILYLVLLKLSYNEQMKILHKLSTIVNLSENGHFCTYQFSPKHHGNIGNEISKKKFQFIFFYFVASFPRQSSQYFLHFAVQFQYKSTVNAGRHHDGCYPEHGNYFLNFIYYYQKFQ